MKVKVGLRLIVSIVAVLIGGHVARAQTGASLGALTAADRVEIQQLIARYSHILDDGADQGRAFASLFTPDGTLVNAGATISGQTKLAAFAAAFHAANAGASNLATNMLIEPAPGGAAGKVYLVATQTTSPGAAGSIVAGGHFEDRYVKTAQGWRFERRQFFPSQLR